jgi:hypothetical protein
MKHRSLIALMLGVILILSLLPALAPAGSEASPLSLPPRPEDVKGGDDDDDEDGQPIGAHIVLHVPSAPDGVWTIVQWQDTAGGWHDIESWSGALDDDTQKTWWLAPDLFGKGPFRWLVYQGERGKLLATSDPFYLPDAEGEKVWVEVSLSE